MAQILCYIKVLELEWVAADLPPRSLNPDNESDIDHVRPISTESLLESLQMFLSTNIPAKRNPWIRAKERSPGGVSVSS